MSIMSIAGGGATTALDNAILEVYSLDILHKAQGVMRFEDFAIRRQELNAAPGEKVNFVIYDDLAIGADKGKLNEHQSLSEQAMVANKKTITIEEWGKAIKVSEKLLRLSWQDVLGEGATLLARDYATVRDLALRDAVSGGLASITYADSTSPFAVGANAAIGDMTAADIFDTNCVRKAVEILESNNAPKFYGDYYVCFIHPHQASSIRRDADWVSAHSYAGSRNIFNGEIGRFEDVIFISTTHAINGANASSLGYDADLNATATAGLNVDLYEALFFGDQALYIADSLPVELRDNGVEDFGRTHGLAWYGLYGCALLQDSFAVKCHSA